MRISDWSSDVCSSDLRGGGRSSRGFGSRLVAHDHASLNSPTRTWEFRIHESFSTHEAHARHSAACDRLVALRLWHDNRLAINGPTPDRGPHASSRSVSGASALASVALHSDVPPAHTHRPRPTPCN